MYQKILLNRKSSYNILLATIARFFSIGSAVISVPLLINNLGNQGYGTWATISSLIATISILDLGFGNSIRNSVAEQNNTRASMVRQEYVSFFQILQFLGFVGAIVFLFGLSRYSFPADQALTIKILYLPLLLCLPLLLSSSVLQGERLYGLQALIQVIPQCSIILYLGLAALGERSTTLPEVAVVYTIANAACLLISFAVGLKLLKIIPSSFTRLSIFSIPGRRLSKSFEFLCLQICTLVVTGLGNILVFHFLGPLEVARYDVINKLFQVLLTFYTVQIGVMWAEISLAKSSCDIQRLRAISRRLAVTALLFSLCCLTIAFIAPLFISKWTSGEVQVLTSECIVIAILVSIQSIAYAGSVFMNAFEEIKPQIAVAVVSSLVMLPLSSFLFSRNMGIISVPLSGIIVFSFAALTCTHYSLRILSRPLQSHVAGSR